MVAHWGTCALQLRHLLPVARRRRLPAARRRRGRRRWAATPLRRSDVVDAQRAPAPCSGPGGWSGRRPGCRSRRHPARCRPRPCWTLRCGGRQRVVRHRRGAHEALPDAVEPACRHGLAAADGRTRPRAAHGPGGGRTTIADWAQRRRVRVPQPRRDRPCVRAVVQRHPPPAGSRAAAAGPGRPSDGSGAGMGHPRSVAVASTARRVRRHPRCDCVRCLSRCVGAGTSTATCPSAERRHTDEGVCCSW